MVEHSILLAPAAATAQDQHTVLLLGVAKHVLVTDRSRLAGMQPGHPCALAASSQLFEVRRPPQARSEFLPVSL